MIKEIEKKKDFRNDLLKRREISVIIQHVGNPGKENAKKFVVEKYKATEDTVVVNNVKGKFGRDTFLIDFFVYDSADDLQKIEPKKKEKKKK